MKTDRELLGVPPVSILRGNLLPGEVVTSCFSGLGPSVLS